MRWAMMMVLGGCAAAPLDPVVPLPDAAVPDVGPRDDADAAVYVGRAPVGRTRTAEAPERRQVGSMIEVTIDVEICDFVDNDGDGLVDEGVGNGCGECGGDQLDATDDDCDGLVDERYLGASCGNDSDCDGALSCLDGWCSDPCPSTCDDCDRCVGHLLADDGALIISANCDEVCADCRGRCDALGGVCVDGGCMRDGRRAGGCRPGEVVEVMLERWVEGGDIEGRLVDVCWP